tara:strand:- start:264 stop:3503 length:3240 start_codon:yes stop_codon:yes gene_type:complete
MAYYIKGEIPGILSGAKYDRISKHSDIESYIKGLFLKYILPKVNGNGIRAIENIPDFDTTYLEKASIEGSPENEFFVEFFAPILDSIDKETNPSELLANIERLKSDPNSYNKNNDSKYSINSQKDKTINVDALVNALEEDGLEFDNFDNKNVNNIPRNKLDQRLNKVEDPNIKRDIFIDATEKGRNETVPVIYTIDGMVDEDGEEIGPIAYAFPLTVGFKSEYFDEDDDGNITITDEGAKNIRKDVLSDSRINQYTRLTTKADDQKDPWKERLDLLIKISDKQEKQGRPIKRAMSLFTKEYNRLRKYYEDQGYTNPGNMMRVGVPDKLVRPINDGEVLDGYNSIVKIAKNKGFDTISYLEDLLGDPSVKVPSEIEQSNILIPYNDFSKKYHVKSQGNTDPDYLYNKFQDAYDKGKTKLPLDRKALQAAINSSFSSEEVENLRYIDSNFYKGIKDKNYKILKQFLEYSTSQGLQIKDVKAEHITPMVDIGKILWEDIFLVMKENNRSEEDIKEALIDTIKYLYAEVILSNREDLEKLRGSFSISSGIGNEDIEKIRRGEYNPEKDQGIWKRYNDALVSIPVKLSDMKKAFPKDIEGVSYEDIVKESKYSLKSILSEFFFHDFSTLEDIKDNFIVSDDKGNEVYKGEVESEDDFEISIEEVNKEHEETLKPINRIVLLITPALKKDASTIAKKYQKIKIGDTQYILDTNKSNKEALIWKKNTQWIPSTSPKTAPKGFRFMNEIRDILSPEASKKINKRRAEELKKMLGGKSFPQAAMDSMKMASEVKQIEEPYKEQLEVLAKEIVYKMYPILKDANIEIDAKISDGMKATPPQKEENEEEIDQEQFDVSVEEAGVDKRRLLNALTQGASLKGSRSYILFDEILNLMSDGLKEKYDELLNNAYGIYNSDEALAMMLAMMSQGGGGAQKGGDVEIFYDEEKDRPVIKATGITFPILLQEIIKGLYENLAQFGTERAEGGTEEDFRKAFIKNTSIRKRTDTYKKELTDMSDGPYAYEALLDVYLSTEMNPQRFPEWYKNLVEVVPSSDFKIFIDNVITGKLSSKDDKYILDTISKTAKELNKDE